MNRIDFQTGMDYKRLRSEWRHHSLKAPAFTWHGCDEKLKECIRSNKYVQSIRGALKEKTLKLR